MRIEFLFVVYFDQKYPATKPIPMTNAISEKLDQMIGESLVNTPKTSPKNAGAISEFGPSEIVGVARIANITIQVIPPNGDGKRFAIAYQHHRMINVPRT